MIKPLTRSSLKEEWRQYANALERLKHELKRLHSYDETGVVQPLESINAVSNDQQFLFKKEDFNFDEHHTSSGTIKVTTKIADVFPILPLSGDIVKLTGATPLPEITKVPKRPEFITIEQGLSEYESRLESVERVHREQLLSAAATMEGEQRIILKRVKRKKKKIDSFVQSLQNGTASPSDKNLKLMAEIAINQNNHFKALIETFRVSVDCISKVALIELKLWDISDLRLWVRRPNSNGTRYLTSKQQRETLKKAAKTAAIILLKSVCHAIGDFGIHTLCLNQTQNWHDKATGSPKLGVTLSVQGDVENILKIDVKKAQTDECFAFLKGLMTPNLEAPTNVTPIMKFGNDKRIVDTKDILGASVQVENLALMDWEDFEHLVAQMLQLHFEADGLDVRVTQSSRDRGVDAILFDPDPLKGGKYVVQAKRYTNVVGVSAVRDLYGTLMNENANRGILITTSSYGADAYEFAKDKQITLVDGQAFLEIITRNHAKHSKNYKIDLEEAKRFQEQQGS